MKESSMKSCEGKNKMAYSPVKHHWGGGARGARAGGAVCPSQTTSGGRGETRGGGVSFLTIEPPASF